MDYFDEDNTDKMQKEIEKARRKTDAEIHKILNRITRLDVNQMSKEDIGFLKARQSYLTSGQRQQYANILNPKLVIKK